jgi:cell volume regulation protein A
LIDPVLQVLMIVAVTILLGVLSDVVFRKTDVPSTLWLLLLGLVLGSFITQADKAQFLDVAGFVSVIAIIIILFDGGMQMDIYKLARHAPRGMALMMLGMVFEFIVLTSIMMFVGFPFLHGLLMAAIVQGTSAAVVIPIITKLRTISEDTRAILAIESVADNFSIVIAFVIMEIMLLAEPSVLTAVNKIISVFSIGLVVGAVAGIVWMWFGRMLVREELSYPVTLGVLMLVYAVVETFGGSGAIACFIFGVMLANTEELYRLFGRRSGTSVLIVSTKGFHSIITFFVRTFFFVYLGLLVVVGDISSYSLGLIIALGILVVKNINVKLVTRGVDSLFKIDRNVMAVMIPRGLAAAVLAYIPYFDKGIPGTDTYHTIVFSIILCTVIITTIGIKWVTRHEAKPKKFVKKKEEHPLKHATEEEKRRARIP